MPFIITLLFLLAQQMGLFMAGQGVGATTPPIPPFPPSGCAGSGVTWACAAGASIADIQGAINGSSDGSTISFAPGAYTWSSMPTLSPSVGVSLVCATYLTCTVTAPSGPVWGMSSYSGVNTHLYRLGGFVFNQSAPGQFLFWFCSGGGCTGTFTQLRLDHNTINLSNGGFGLVLGESSSVTHHYGVMDHNTFNCPTSCEILYMLGATNPSPPSSPLGTANNMFVENNTINIANMTDAGQGIVDGWAQNNMVIRYNTSTNGLWTSHGTTHGGGPQNIEFYNNDSRVNANAAGFLDGYRLFHHQGSGEFIAFNNKFTAYSGKSTSAMEFLFYPDYCPNSIDGGLPCCDGTQSRDGNRTPLSIYRGYPCWRQPGRDAATGNLYPMYSWNNYWSDTGAQVALAVPDYAAGSPDYHPQHLVTDRDYFNAVSTLAQTSSSSPFNGTTGMGWGTIANRPATCSIGATDAGDSGRGGVGYFATDVGALGTLCTCTAVNTWTSFYVPYTYPHPLDTP